MKLQETLVAALLCALTVAANSVPSSKLDCSKQGFNSLTLLCSDCDQLDSFVQDAELVAECQQCCAEDSVAQDTVYTSAVLQYCPHTIKSLPHIDNFIKDKAAAFQSLTLQERPGHLPRLKMVGPGGKAAQVDVSQWKTENVEEYLRDKLRPPAAATEES